MAQFTNTKEFHELQSEFERVYKYEPMEKESKALNTKGVFYQNGITNKLFNAFMQGYQLAKSKNNIGDLV